MSLYFFTARKFGRCNCGKDLRPGEVIARQTAGKRSKYLCKACGQVLQGKGIAATGAVEEPPEHLKQSAPNRRAFWMDTDGRDDEPESFE